MAVVAALLGVTEPAAVVPGEAVELPVLEQEPLRWLRATGEEPKPEQLQR